MKLRNKKTGDIAEPFGITCVNGRTFVQFDDGKGTFKFEARCLADLNNAWEDYEEPKTAWFINSQGDAHAWPNAEGDDWAKEKAIGNYFETQEEAEKAVEKLKAWKRLKDKGFGFNDWNNPSAGPYSPIWFYFEKDTAIEDVKADLDLLFGGEE